MTQSSNDYVMCKVDGCPTEANGARGYCRTHHWRLWKYGDPGPAERRPGTKLPCYRDDCDRPRKIGIRCILHGRRFQKHGDDNYSGRGTKPKAAPKPPWEGKAQPPSKEVVTGYLYSLRGAARSNACTQCNSRAERWAYNHRDPQELWTKDHTPYSLDPQFYEPMCLSCEEQLLNVLRPRIRRRVVSNGR